MRIMIINFSTNNTSNQVSFNGGLTKKMLSEINSIDTNKIESYLGTNAVNAEFKNNQFVAWSVLKVFEFFRKLHSQYKINIALPRNILTEDLCALKIKNPHGTYGFTNFLPCRINKNSQNVTPAMSVIFNRDFPWHKIDEISDLEYRERNTSTDFFLEAFFHEFSHIAHEGHLLKRYGAMQTLQRLISLTDDKAVGAYKNIFGDSFAKSICYRANVNPIELIACDMSKRFIENMDKNSIQAVRNPYKNSPYQSFFQFRNLLKNNEQDVIINRFFNGKTKWLKTYQTN